MFFLLNRQDRTGSILQIMLYTYSYCFKNNIIFDGLISNNMWWDTEYFFKMVEKYFNIKNKKVNKNTLTYIPFKEIIKYPKKISNINSNNLYSIFDVKTLCPYFTKNINFFFDETFKEHINSNLKVKAINTHKIIISLHIRRGDVNKEIPQRYTNDKVYINIINNLIKVLSNYEIHIFSEQNFNGNIKLFEKIKNVKIHLEKNSGNLKHVFEDILFMILSDYLICSKSSFSYTPSLINKNIVYFNNKFWCSPLNNFIIYDDNTGKLIKN